MSEARRLSLVRPGPALDAAVEAASRDAGPRPHDVVRMNAVMDAFGLSARAIRFYEERGLIAPRRDALNRRLYDEPTRARLSVITQLRRAGLGLDDIIELFARPPGTGWRQRARELLGRRRAEIERDLAAVDAAVGWLATPSRIPRSAL